MKAASKKIPQIILLGLIIFFSATGCQNKVETVSTKDFQISKIGDYPVFEMDYNLDYRPGSSSSTVLEDASFACSVFAAANNQGGYLMGRNFDWEHNPILVLHTSPSNGYKSISMVNLGFLGINAEQAADLMDRIDVYKYKLSQVPFLPVDGMNEKGLSIGMAAVPKGEDNSDKPAMGSLGIMREVLDLASNVDEALDIIQSYRIEFGGGPPVHYLIADAEGNSAVVEYGSGEMQVIRNESNWLAMTNFLLEESGSAPELQCDRYKKISEKLNKNGGSLSIKESMQLLSDVSQGDPQVEGTQWSVIYDLSQKSLSLGVAKDFAHLFTFAIK